MDTIMVTEITRCKESHHSYFSALFHTFPKKYREKGVLLHNVRSDILLALFKAHGGGCGGLFTPEYTAYLEQLTRELAALLEEPLPERNEKRDLHQVR
jgi:hypothetical protein